MFFARAELVLARDAMWPTRATALVPDPLTPLALAMADLYADESLGVVLDLCPRTPASRRRWRKKALARFERADSRSAVGVGQQIVDEVTRNSALERKRRRVTPAGIERRELTFEQRSVHEHLRVDEPQFEVCVLVRVSSPIAGRVPAILATALAAFDTMGGQNNWWRVRGWRLGGRHRGADATRRSRRRFDARFDGGKVQVRGRNRVFAHQIAAFLRPPTSTNTAPNVVRSVGVVAPPPSSLRRWAPGRGLWPLGVVRTRRDDEYLAAVPLADTLFTLTTGASGCGKTESALGRVLAAVDSGAGVVFVDPHGDAAQRIKSFLGPYEDRVYELTLEMGLTHQCGWNPLAIDHPGQLEERMASVTDALATSAHWQHGRTNRAIGITTGTIRTLLELSLILPADAKPTIFQVASLLGDEDWRGEVVAKLSRQTRDYWRRFSYRGESLSPLLSLVERLRTARSTAALLGASEPTFGMRTALDRGGIVLVRPRGLDNTDKLVASLVLHGAVEALLSRRDLDPTDRRPCHVVVDEAQLVDEAIAKLLAVLAEQSRKFGGRMHLMAQDPDRLSALTLGAVMTNRSHLFTSAIDAQGASLYAREWRGVAPATLQNLERYRFVAQVTSGGVRSDPFMVRSVPLEELWADLHDPTGVGRLGVAIARNTGYVPVDDTLARLDTLDDRIIDHLHAGLTQTSSRPEAGGVSPYEPGRVRASYE